MMFPDKLLKSLGLIEITQRGAAGIGDHAQAHRFRLTYVQPNPTDEWGKHHDPGMAQITAETARKSANIRARKLELTDFYEGAGDFASDDGYPRGPQAQAADLPTTNMSRERAAFRSRARRRPREVEALIGSAWADMAESGTNLSLPIPRRPSPRPRRS